MKSTIFRHLPFAWAAALLLFVGACQDMPAPTAPELAADSVPEASAERADGLLSGLLSLSSSKDHPELDVLRRTEALDKDEVATARVGLLGATLHLRRAGLTVIIPSGAAPLGTRITVRAPAGDLVGYHFEPHGLRFRLPVTLAQSLGNTEAAVGLVRPTVGGYFKGELTPVVSALEVLPLRLIGGLTGHAIFQITHFSGYIVATN